MRKILLGAFVFGLVILEARAQEGESPSNSTVSPQQVSSPFSSFKERVFAGGNLGASFGTIQYLYLAPIVGYRITPKFSAGGGIIYQYLRDTRPPELTTNNYGGNLFARRAIYGPLFAQIEYEYLNFEYVTNFNGTEFQTARRGYNSVFIGGGIAQPLGRNAAFMLSAFYNLTYDSSEQISPYSRPWVFRVGIVAGF